MVFNLRELSDKSQYFHMPDILIITFKKAPIYQFRCFKKIGKIKHPIIHFRRNNSFNWRINLHITTYYLSDSANEHGYQAFLDNDRLFGKYWYGYWGYSLFDLLSILLFLIKPIRQNYFFSLLVMILSQTVFMLQRFIIMVTSSHWDYIPTSWTLYVDWKELILFSIIPSVMLSFLLIFFNIRKNQISKE